MNLRHAENYNIGLDIGTGSVGWSVTDENGELYHFKGRPTWGSRLFPSAETAAVARGPRGQRRRYDRRRQRLDLLQGFFAEEMNEIDPEFFIRLRQSRLWKEDRAEGCKDYRWPLFNGSDFTESDYYKRFPTIYHLRVWLMETDEPADIRLVYLALHNIVKVRGNFLYQDNPGLSAKNANMRGSVERLKDALEAWCTARDYGYRIDAQAFQGALENAQLTRREKLDVLKSSIGFDVDGPARSLAISNAVLGYQAAFDKVFDIEGELIKFSLTKDDKVEEFYAICPDDGIELYEALQAVHSSYILAGILKGGEGKTISHCKVAEYERYGGDLRLLKTLVRQYRPTEYDAFFRGPHYDAPFQRDYDASKAHGYTAYNLGTSKLGYEDFKKAVEKLFKGSSAESDDRYIQMMQGFTEETFLRRLKTSDNGSIPYQLHLEEMKAIIERQGKHHPFLLAKEKELESLVSFRIPYYVGPLTTKNAAVKPGTTDMRFAWSERLPGKEHAPVYPWNWEDVIDKDKSAENFIRRMTGTCTYLQDEPVLPKCSLLYEKFCVLNELNGSRWTQDGDLETRFSAEDRLGIFDDLFKEGSVSYAKVEAWLERDNRLNPHVSGGQGESKFESKLSSYLFFRKLLGVEDLTPEQEAMAENLILWNTLFEDRAILRERILKEYGDVLNEEQVKKFCKKRFSGWGRLSRKFLCGLKAQTANGPMSIMDILIEGNPEGPHIGSSMILMEILHDKHFGFEELVDEFNKAKAAEKGGMTVEDLPGSPALRRSVNQALRVVEEIASIAGKAPQNIFIEVTRDDDFSKKGKRTTRRYDSLKEALAGLGPEGRSALDELKKMRPDALDARLSLYFMQNAKCLYCGKALDINLVIGSNQAYQVDHIIPQSYIKDDSFENRALVCSGCNQKKTDELLIDPEIRRRMAPAWRQLHGAGLIGKKKLANLLRDHITVGQMRGFINRQLVETSQTVKFVRQMLADRYPDTRVESIKASLSHQLREERGFVKCREANNYHHAHDALLASEIGRFIQLRHGNIFDNPIAATHAMRAYVKRVGEQYKRTHKMPGSASYIIGSFLTSGFDADTGEIFQDCWDAEGECERIRRYLNYKDCFISRMPEITSGAFWDATIYSPKGSSKKLSLPLKKGLDPRKYGSYSREQFAYFFVYRATKKRKTVFEFAAVPLSVAAAVEKDPSELERYALSLANEKGLAFIDVARRRIPKYQLIELNGDRLYITGVREVRNAREFAFDQTDMAFLAEVCKGDLPDDEAFDAFYDSLCDKYDRYAMKLGRQMAVSEMNAKYREVDAQAKARIVLSLVAIANARTNMIDLSAIGGSKYSGCMNPSFTKLLSAADSDITFIDQSVTGMFERRQCLEF